MKSECESHVIEHVQRLKEVEDKVAGYDRLIPVLVTEIKEMSSSLKAVKWAAIGAAYLFVAQQMGLIEVLKKVLL